jgi:chemotaxis protein MotB
VTRRRRKEDGGFKVKSDSWMVTFSDLSTLLLTFFVLLLSMSSMDDLTLKSSFYSFTSSCGILRFKEYDEIYRPKEKLIEGLYIQLKDGLIIKKQEEETTEKEIPSDILNNPFKNASTSLVFQNTLDGFKLVFGQELLFGSGSAEIREEAEPVLNQIAKFIRISGYQIYIDGHTDDLPIHNETYPSNDELSLARAYNVMSFLVRNGGVPAVSIALAGYGERFPVTSDFSLEGRAKNRRVEIIFKNQKYY